ncbi:o-succinylbenzoate synthase [Catalinimonas alkaloidigena]|uniref:O-succinylbenzoate synthase n=1 Tax=Catalinimonas alkaloidigena TaxID=1075417 RepID=A0A1G9HFI6_9BACT|nr:o-succinylbenzoate synthase [Catalinimonas alkaloidigena]SDL11677.1 o-succinylbenzoate synthase [Catalinimonas alkaloidigena]
MRITCTYLPYQLRFRFEAGTSRGVLTEKKTWLIRLTVEAFPGREGWGECGPLRGLSPDDRPDFEARLHEICQNLSAVTYDPNNEAALLDALVPSEFPSIRFGLESALADWRNGGVRRIFDNAFSRGDAGLPINGLIWMGSAAFMREQMEQKLASGYNCLKMKIGAIDFEAECALLEEIRKNYSPDQITLRVDANGAFAPDQALARLQRLAQYELHSIEQPIRAGQVAEMAKLCAETPLPIALDEELIGVYGREAKARLLDQVRPQYVILKPTLVGGFRACREWIELAEARQIGWWITSALESNIGLNAIAQFTDEYDIHLPQGLGTGQLYHNNVQAPLTILQGFLHYDPQGTWQFPTAGPMPPA